MPTISRLFLKTGFIYFLGSLLLGIVIEIESLLIPVMTPLFWHMLMVGWITQIIFGVSLWMFPGRPREEGFIPHLRGWLTYLFLNAGLLLRIVAEPQVYSDGPLFWDILIVVSAVLQLAAGLTYLLEIWPRVQSKSQRIAHRKRQRNE